MRRFAFLLVSLALACGDSTSEPTPASVAGTWELQTVNGAALPFVLVQIGTSKTELVSDVVTATSTGTYTQVSTIRTTVNGQATTSTQPNGGTYTLNGTAVVFQASNGSTGTGTINGNTFTLAMNGLSFVYTKR